MAGASRLVVIDIINVLRVSVKAKNDALVGANRYRPETLLLAFKGMQPKARQIHMGDSGGGV